MKHQTDPDYLQRQAYNDAHDLDVRTHILTHYRAHSQSWYCWLFDQLMLPENGRILELGSGPGDLWQQNADRLPPGWQICLSDLSNGMVQEARQRLLQSPNPTAASFALLDTMHLPFADRSLEAVLAFGVLDHLPDGRLALAEVRRVLRPGGLFYASAGGQNHLTQLEALIKPFLPEAQYGGDADRFGLQNGARFLAPFFAQVEQRPYANKLLFQDPDPIAAYILSEVEVRQQLSASQYSAFQKHLAQELARRGKITVTIEKGVFIARTASLT